MTKKEQRADEGRRNFLKLATMAPAAAAAGVVGGEAAADEVVAEQGEGLRKTEHVKKYLASARF